MHKLKIFTIWLGGLSLLLITISSAFSYYLTRPYYKIEIGMNENQVIEIFGESYPLIDRGEKPFLCDTKAWRGDCKEVQNSDVTYFLTFQIFFDTYAIIGFKNNIVTFKGIGDA